MYLQIINDCAGTDPGLQTTGTDPGVRYGWVALKDKYNTYAITINGLARYYNHNLIIEVETIM